MSVGVGAGVSAAPLPPPQKCARGRRNKHTATTAARTRPTARRVRLNGMLEANIASGTRFPGKGRSCEGGGGACAAWRHGAAPGEDGAVDEGAGSLVTGERRVAASLSLSRSFLFFSRRGHPPLARSGPTHAHARTPPPPPSLPARPDTHASLPGKGASTACSFRERAFCISAASQPTVLSPGAHTHTHTMAAPSQVRGGRGSRHRRTRARER